MKTVFKIWGETFSLLTKHPKIIFPLVITAILNAGSVYLMYLAPQRPVYFLLGPPVRRFFGERFLHYPLNFFILPKLCNYAEIFISAFFGMLMTAVTIGMIADVLKKERPSFLVNFITGIKRYFSLFIVWVITFGFVIVVTKFLPVWLKAQGEIKKTAFISIYFLSAVFVQVLFIYAVPSLIIKKKKLFPALKENFVVLSKKFIPTIILAMLPAIFYIPVIIAKTNIVFLAKKLFPEIVLVILGISVAVSFLIDMIVTVSTTVLFLEEDKVKKNKKFKK